MKAVASDSAADRRRKRFDWIFMEVMSQDYRGQIADVFSLKIGCDSGNCRQKTGNDLKSLRKE
jgi:hypothetical protein